MNVLAFWTCNCVWLFRVKWMIWVFLLGRWLPIRKSNKAVQWQLYPPPRLYFKQFLSPFLKRSTSSSNGTVQYMVITQQQQPNNYTWTVTVTLRRFNWCLLHIVLMNWTKFHEKSFKTCWRYGADTKCRLQHLTFKCYQSLS